MLKVNILVCMHSGIYRHIKTICIIEMIDTIIIVIWWRRFW